MLNNLRHDPQEGSFYFGSWRRSIITVPLLLLLIMGPVYHGVMSVLLQVDLFIGHFLFWLILGWMGAGTMGLLPLTVVSLPLVLVPVLWHSRMWRLASTTMRLLSSE